jgi:hypothetical protein
MEQYFWLTNQLYGWSWLLRPGVLIIMSLIVVPIVFQLWRRHRAGTGGETSGRSVAAIPQRPAVARVLAIVMLVIFAYALWEMTGFNRDSRLLPMLAILPGLVFAAATVLQSLRARGEGVTGDRFSEPYYLLALIAYGIAMWAIGFNLATAALLIWMLFWCARMRPLTGLIYALLVFAAIHGLFKLMNFAPPAGTFFKLI